MTWTGEKQRTTHKEPQKPKRTGKPTQQQRKTKKSVRKLPNRQKERDKTHNRIDKDQERAGKERSEQRPENITGNHWRKKGNDTEQAGREPERQEHMKDEKKAKELTKQNTEVV